LPVDLCRNPLRKGGSLLEKAATKPTASGGKTRTPANTPRQLIFRWYGLLFSDDVYQRMAGFLLWGLVIIAVTWAVAFFCLPDGLLENTMIVRKIFGIRGSTRPGEWGFKWLGETAKIFGREFSPEDLFGTWGNILLVTGKIFLHHLLVVFAFIFLFNRFRIRRLPFGYLYFLVYTILLALAAGTESFTYPPQGDTVLGEIILFLRFALIEWFAYGLLAVATLKWTWVKADSFLKGRWEKVDRFFSWPALVRDEKDLLIFGLLFLLVANFSEAKLIVFYGRHLL
jgi:hypothetical protein